MPYLVEELLFGVRKDNADKLGRYAAYFPSFGSFLHRIGGYVMEGIEGVGMKASMGLLPKWSQDCSSFHERVNGRDCVVNRGHALKTPMYSTSTIMRRLNVEIALRFLYCS